MVANQFRAIVPHLQSFIILSLLVAALVACSSPAERINKEAAGYGFISQVIEGRGYKHQVYHAHQQGYKQEATLHVYLEGDGMPWVNHQWVASDPTSREPLMLRLMAIDTAPSLYLGRPCYHGYSSTPPCTPGLWTDARYSENVIAGMAQVLNFALLFLSVEDSPG
jgi:hypothetical protein